MQLPTLVPRCCRKPRRSNHADLRENRCDIRCYWRNRGQQHGPSRSVVRLPSSVLSSSLLRLSSSLLPSSLLCLLSSPLPSSLLVSLLKETLRPPRAAFFSHRSTNSK